MSTNQTGLEIAIVGLAGRFPGGDRIDDFWHNLKTGTELVTAFSQPVSEGDARGSSTSPAIVRAGAVLQNVDQFDAAFFGFNPGEAAALDPQHRLFLESAWEALENAGYSSATPERPIGVFAGVGMGTYLLYNLSPNPGFIESRGFLPTLVGVDKDYLPTRVSYKLNLTGPSVSVGTACSSSLVAVHLACQSLLSGECDMALAAGVAVKVPQDGRTLSPDEIISPDGHCRAFDANANGTVGGNGIGVVVLKRLEDAIADRDHIYAVIKGSAMNNDGATKVSYTAPSQSGQANVIRAAHLMAEVEPETITYLETHGTGTALGDPIEIAAMTQAFRMATDRTGFCAIGSVKTNVGHLDAAAGITGLIKTVLALHHRQIPPSINFVTPNAQIDFANSPFYVNTQLTDWNPHGIPRRAGVSSFGFGGTNVHLVLEEAPVLSPGITTSQQRPYQLLTLSAKTATALKQATMNLQNRLKQAPELNLADVAYTLQMGRWEFPHRWFAVAQTGDDAVQSCTTPPGSTAHAGDNPAVIFMFPGQGSQAVNMARQLYEHEPTFRENCDRCFALLQAQHNLDLRAILYPDSATDSQPLTQTAIAQPALFVVEYALAQLWMSWGVQPHSFIGHSIGEYVAACLAGVFTLEEALSLVTVRAQLMQQQPPGTMLVVYLSADAVQPFLSDSLSLAANNSPALCVVSGATGAIAQLEQELAAQGIDSRRLHTSHAFHSPMMEAVIDPLVQHLQQVRLHPPQIPLISNVTGTWLTDQEATDPQYWAQHLRQTVQFAPGMAELLSQPEAIFLEVGPGRTLATLTKHQTSDRLILTSLPHLHEKVDDGQFLLQTLGRLWLNGVSIDWSTFYAHQSRCRVPLPTYPFERQRYWIDPPQAAPIAATTLSKQTDIADWFYIPAWKRSVLPPIAASDQTRCWVVFVDRSGLATALIQRLQHQGHRVIQVHAGEQFCQSQPNRYTIDPGDRDQYAALMQTILASEPNPILAHLWTIDPDLAWADAQTLGFYSLLYLAQAIGQQSIDNSVHINVLSSQIQEITGEEICPEKVTVLGACKVIPQEYANLACTHIDVAIPAPETSTSELLIEQLIQEMLMQAAQPSDPVIAYRGHYRWLPIYEPVRLEAKHQSTPLRSQGVYLITGGLGGIGLTIAEYLAKTVQAKIVLVNRSTLPPRSDWQQWLATHPAPDATTLKLQKIQALEAIGSEVMILSADVADLGQMQAAIAQIQPIFGQLHGIFHTAGVPGNGIMQLKTPEMVAAVMAAKVQGTLVLNQVCQDMPLDFLVLFSSHSAILGGMGQVDYCAANAFLDAFAHSQAAQTHHRTLAINWDMWQDVGMGADLTQLPDRLQQERLAALETGIAPEEGVAALHRILQSGYHQVIVSTKDWQAVLQQSLQRTIATVEVAPITPEIPSADQTSHARSLQSTTYVAPSNEIEQQIAALWQEQLGIKPVGVNDNFFELGGHSLLAVRIVARLRELYPVDLSLKVLLSEAPTVAGLAQVIAEQLTQLNDADELARVLAEIEQLSPEAVQAQLAKTSANP
ncbi:SDR family NAD(P)-dependent oxidoreductase [Pantanalinema rosaneae CENA516]|uniref:type I polyketide synthase n=1 Tax=Pantanalinema rosaneae TaxID=1620701 RepID=UPI003D6EEA6D